MDEVERRVMDRFGVQLTREVVVWSKNATDKDGGAR
jgi:UDP-N-acetylenolpyruvoylglucosamine reductase